MPDTGVERTVVGVSAMLDLDDVQEWTPELLEEFLTRERTTDLDWRRFEIVDGVLVVSPQAAPLHEIVMLRLGAMLVDAPPDGFTAAGAIGVRIGRSYAVTDLTVIAITARRATGALAATEVLLAVEIESPSSITTDRITKPAQYAAAGIPFYWRVETDPLKLVTYRLVDGVYVESGSWSAGEAASIIDPFAVEIDVASLLP